MKLLRSQLCFLFAAFFLAACTQNRTAAPELSEKEAKAISDRSFKMGEPLPPIDDFSLRDTIVHSMCQKSQRLDLQNLRFYDRKVQRSDLLPLQGPEASHINVLVLSNLLLDDADIEPIGKMNLVRLSLSYNPVRDLHALRTMKSLQDLNLDYSQVDREGLQVAANITSLTSLRLNGTKISDADLPLLYSLNRLQELDVIECKNISPSGVAKLRQAIPGCKVQTGSEQKGFQEVGLSDLRAVEEGLMRQKEYAEADLALQKFISSWQRQESPPLELLANAYRLRGQCQKALGNSSLAEKMFVESSKYHRRSSDLKNHPK